MASKYQKLSQLEHVLHRSETYVGGLESQTRPEWVYENGKMIKKDIEYSPGLYKIFDEILVNSADCRNRDEKMNVLKVCIDESSVSIHNNGCSIPIEMHDTEKCYVPELIFGHLLTSENYDDTQDRFVGGRNGYGSKLTNVFSKKFVVEICDGKNKYKQSWTDNMHVCGKPKITACSKEPYITTTFHPDFEKFGIEKFYNNIISLFTKRVYDMVAVLGKAVKVSLNGKRVEIKSTGDYVNLFIGGKADAPRAFESSNGWDIAVSNNSDFDQVSLVNACATRGGTHVNAIIDQISKAVVEAASKKKVVVKASTVKNNMFVFVNAKVANPTFDSQTKDVLTTKVKFMASDAFVKKSVGILLDAVMAETSVRASLADDKLLKKTDGTKKARVSGIPKLKDASLAGTKHGNRCTLILTEGDSAKTLAMAGLSVVGHELYGIFPLRGKLLNVRGASVSQITNNAEITAIKQILGLQAGKVYKDTSSLRYGHVMIMADQDTDGTHVGALAINFFHTCFPSLLEIPGFLKKMITPIVRVTKGKESKEFYGLRDYEEFRIKEDMKKWTTKYFKVRSTF